MTTPGYGANTSQMFAEVVYAAGSGAPVRTAQLFAMAVYTPTQAMIARAGQLFAEVVYSSNPNNIGHASQMFAQVVYSTNAGPETRTTAWSFTLDGHTFYVLDLGDTGTFLFDTTTGNWCQFRTTGFNGWNIRTGTTFSDYNRVVGGDTLYGYVWELDPDAILDEGFRSIQHIATAMIATRSRVFQGVEAVRIVGAMGLIMYDGPVVMSMAFSDDNGVTWSGEFEITLTPGDSTGEAAWTSMGSFMSPGRVFRFTDVGGMFRIDGADVFIENFDDQELTTKKYEASIARTVNQSG